MSASYDKALQRLYRLAKFGVKMGLDNMLVLASRFGSPHRDFPSVHIAGTNGKGSVCAKIAKAYEISGQKVGLYTSPHINSYRERIQINGTPISEQDVASLLDEIFQAEPLPAATFFEITTLLAFLYFSRQKVDVAVIETGLGGRLDATNIVHPRLSVITSISLDHTEFLGSTIEAIAREKAGIIKPPVPVVASPRFPTNLLKSCGSPYEQVEGTFKTFDEENQAVAQAALKWLGLPPAGLDARPPCRIQQVTGKKVPVILDVAHNPDGLLHLFDAVAIRPLRVVCGLSSNKDIDACMRIIASQACFIHLTSAANDRALPVEAIAGSLEKLQFSHFQKHYSIRDAIDTAMQHREAVLICGTFFIMGDAMEALGLPCIRDPLPVTENCKKL